MAKLSKKIRKGASRVAGSRFVAEVLEEVIAAALIAAAATFAESRTAAKVKRRAEDAVGGLTAGGKTKAKSKKSMAKARRKK